LVALALVTGSIQRATADGPYYVVRALCAGDSSNSARLVNNHQGKLVLKLKGKAGWDVYNSNPGVNPGNTYPTTASSAPTGTYTFNVSGLDIPGYYLQMHVFDSEGGYDFEQWPIANGKVSVISPGPSNPGASVAAIFCYITNESQSEPDASNSITVTNLAFDGAALSFDTTHKDDNVDTYPNPPYSWCTAF
jgi:hypothetical protein